MNKSDFKKEDLDKVVTLGVLLEYTDEFLIPRFADVVKEIVPSIIKELVPPMIKEANGQLTHELKVYIDEKLADYSSDIFKRLDKKYEKEKQFKEKVVQLFKKHKIGSPEDVAFLEGLVQGS